MILCRIGTVQVEAHYANGVVTCNTPPNIDSTTVSFSLSVTNANLSVPSPSGITYPFFYSLL